MKQYQIVWVAGGIIWIEANNPQEARETFNNIDFQELLDSSTDLEIDDIKDEEGNSIYDTEGE